jgi:hypothetical protein
LASRARRIAHAALGQDVSPSVDRGKEAVRIVHLLLTDARHYRDRSVLACGF